MIHENGNVSSELYFFPAKVMIPGCFQGWGFHGTHRTSLEATQFLNRCLCIGSREYFDFQSASGLCRLFSNQFDEGELGHLISTTIYSLRTFTQRIPRLVSQRELTILIQSIDATVMSLLNEENIRNLPNGSYVRILLDLGDIVMRPMVGSSTVIERLKSLNCEGFLGDCYRGWRDALEFNVREHLVENSSGWALMERHFIRRDLDEGSDDNPTGPMFDFTPVVQRTPIYSVAERKMDSIAVNRTHIAFFRYLVSRKELSQNIISLISVHNRENNEGTTKDDPNVTIINNTPGRRGSVDSMASYQSADYTTRPLNTCMDIFSVHCLIFFNSFGTGLMCQISNDLIHSISSPPSDFLKLMLSLAPSAASTEGHMAVKKYLSTQLLISLRNMVRNRSDHTASEDGCLSFLMKAEMSAISSRKGIVQDYRVVSALVDSVLRFSISEKSREKRTWISRLRKKETTKLIEWLEYLSAPCSGPSPIVQTMIQSPDGRKELRAIYREISAASVSGTTLWEHLLSLMVLKCPRLLRSDFRHLVTTANGLGISPANARPTTPDLDIPAHIQDELPQPLMYDSPAVQSHDDLLERLVLIEATQVGVAAELEVIKASQKELQEQVESMQRKRVPSVSPLRDDPLSVDAKLEAVFKKLAEGG